MDDLPADFHGAPNPKVRLVAAASLKSPSGIRRPGAASGQDQHLFYKSAQWSADGTTVIASTSAHTLLSYVLPFNLLQDPPTSDGSEDDSSETSDDEEESSSGNSASSSASALSSSQSSSFSSCPSSSSTVRHHRLSPQGCLYLPEAANAIAPAPYFSLAHPGTQSVLVACRDLPIHLYPLFPNDDADDNNDNEDHNHHPRHSPLHAPRPQPLAAYPLIKAETEAYMGPTALLWPAPGTHFIAGTTNLLALFDASRTTKDGPILRVPTIPSARHLRKGNGVGMRGTVSALSAQSYSRDAELGAGIGCGLIAAGTWTRCIGLYDLSRAGGQCYATWSVAERAGGGTGRGADDADASLDTVYTGGGVLQTLWSPCGRYLVVNERRSRGLLVYDVRGSGQLLCTLTGRPAETNQRLSCDVYMSAGNASDGSGGFEVWAGTQQGKTVVWEGVGQQEGHAPPTWSWQAHENSAVGSTAMHNSGSVMATCSGSWMFPSHGGASGDSGGNYNSDDSDATADMPSVVTTEASLKIWSVI